MREGLQTLPVAFVALLIAASLTACGGGDSSNSTTAETGSQEQSEGKSSGTSSEQGNATNGRAEGKSSEEERSGGSNSSDFVPTQHEDSGGGSEQFRTKGGDNSVQEFGAEADASEFEQAAAVLHNFLDARAEGDWAAACDYMSASVIDSFEELGTQAEETEDASCAGSLEKLINPAAKQLMKAEAAQADAGSLRVEDGSAFLIYTGVEGTVIAMPMANEDGGWKVASISGTPLL